MTPSRDPPPTYHIVPRFDIAAKGGALELGTVVRSLSTLRPLNREQVIPVPDRLKYTRVSQGGFVETHSRLREGHGSIWAKSLACQGFGASATVSADDEAENTVSCESIITSYFDPDDGYVAQSLALRTVDKYLSDTDYEHDVYLIPGLKVAKKLRFNSSTTAARSANFEVEGTEPNTNTMLGMSGGGGSKFEHSLEFEVDDIVVGFRVSRYTYQPASWNPFNKEKRLLGTDYLKNAKMWGEGKEEIKNIQLNFVQVPIPDEEKAREKACNSGDLDGNDEVWVEISAD